MSQGRVIVETAASTTRVANASWHRSADSSAMSNPTPASVSQKLTSTSSLLLERSRVLSLNLPPSASSQSQIVRNLTAIKKDLSKLEDEIDLESGGLRVGAGKGREREEGAVVRSLGEQYERLIEIFEEDEAGRDKVRSGNLRREAKMAKGSDRPSIDTTSADLPVSHLTRVPQVNLEPPTPADEPFRDFLDDEDGGDSGSVTPQQMLSNQQQMMDEQDDRLALLSNSIGRQNTLSMQIGSELDIHHDLLEDTDAAMDRTSDRLRRARRRLDHVADNAKQHGSTVTIVVLILILLILVIVFKT